MNDNTFSALMPGLLGGVPDEFLRTALLAGGVGLWEWPIGSPRMAISPYLETQLGYPANGFDGTKDSFLARIDPLDLPRLKSTFALAVESGNECDLEFRLANLHGGHRWFAARGLVMRDDSGTAVRLVGTMQEVPAAIVTERRMRRQQAALLALVSHRDFGEGARLDATLARVAIVAGETLDVERVSVWLFTDDRKELACRALAVHGSAVPVSDGPLLAARFPAYMSALAQNRALDVGDARNDPRTRELAEPYLVARGISSLLEATIRMDDSTLVGVVCHEHVGPMRQWLLDERSFAASIADMITRALTDDRRRRLTAALARSEERYRTYVSISTEAILRAEFDPPVLLDRSPAQQARQLAERAVIVECNPALARMLGVDSPDDVCGRTVASVLPVGVAHRVADEWVRSSYRLREQEFQITTSDGRTLWVLGSCTGVAEGGALKGIWSTWRDITARKDAVARLKHQARHDPLTGLPNRKWVAEHLGEAIALAHSRGERLALLLMDLDHFKEINDGLGHHAGDQLLKLVGPRLKPLLDAASAEMARMGGDEFAIIVREAGADGAVLACARDIATAVCGPYQVGELQLGVDASVGAAVFPTHGSDASTLLRCADVAMYEAKRKRSRVEVYAPDLDRHSPRRLALANALGAAIRSGQIEVHYQPMVALSAPRLAGVEALVRWRHPEFGLIDPAEFIPIAELGDQIRQLTLHVLDESARQWQAWHAAGLSTTISINLSTRVLVDTSFGRDARRLLETRGVRGEHIHFEITESAMLADPSRALDAVSELNALGIGFSIDDYGIGFSSLSYLRQLPLASLKIDRSFVLQMATSESNAAIVRSTINLAHDLGFAVVAEGVETDEVFALLRQMGCDLAQGYAIARPAPAGALLEWARANAFA